MFICNRQFVRIQKGVKVDTTKPVDIIAELGNQCAKYDGFHLVGIIDEGATSALLILEKEISN